MRKYLLLCAILSAIFLTHYAISGQAVYGDGIDYWAYLHTWYFDRNLDLENEYRHIYSPENNNSPTESFSPKVQKTSITPLGKTDNIHPIGTSLFLFPWYFLADILARILNLFGLPIIPNGYSDIYQIICGLGVVVYITVAVFLTKKLCFRLTANEKASTLSAAAIIFCSQLLYYSAYDNLNSHFASYLISVIFWFLLFTFDFSKRKNQIIAGAVVAVAALVRLQDGLLIIPLIFLLNNLSRTIITLFSAGLVFVPQLLTWQYLYGLPYPYRYLTDYLHWDFLGSLFHPVTGLIRNPINFLALAGLPHAKKTTLIFLSFVIPTYLLVSIQGGWSAASYGARMYISVLPFIAVLLAYLFSRWKYKLALLVIIILAILNLASIGSFVLFEKEVNSGLKRGLEESTLQKLRPLIPYGLPNP